jgi:histidine ammonia-lyase
MKVVIFVPTETYHRLYYMSNLSIANFCRIVNCEAEIILEDRDMSQIRASFDFLKEYSSDRVIYGINTGFGPMAQFKIADSNLESLQYNLIRSHCSGMGRVLDTKSARAVMVARHQSFLQGKSGISPEVMKILTRVINSNIIPEIFEHGGVGASGDLVQLSQLSLNLVGEGFVYVGGSRVKAAEALKTAGIEPLKLQLRDGLGLINGTSCMTGLGVINVANAECLLGWSVFCSSCINELMESFDDSMSDELNSAKRHLGQRSIANSMRAILFDSHRMKNRGKYFKENDDGKDDVYKKKVQEYYSIRCVPQILGPILDTINQTKDILNNELNSTNDNPIVDVEAGEVFHGGNFHGDYVSLEMDKLKIVVTKMMMLCERQLNFLLNPALNQKFPPFLNSNSLGLNFGLQGAQFTATSTVAECQTLSFPNYIHSIPNNNDNQDIVSMGMNSASITKTVVENGFEIMSIHLLGVYKAFDLLDNSEQQDMSSKSQKVFHDLGQLVKFSSEDAPLNDDLSKIQSFLKTYSLK